LENLFSQIYRSLLLVMYVWEWNSLIMMQFKNGDNLLVLQILKKQKMKLLYLSEQYMEQMVQETLSMEVILQSLLKEN
jgi:hypothetical protein